jgi:hypothetical protein
MGKNQRHVKKKRLAFVFFDKPQVCAAESNPANTPRNSHRRSPVIPLGSGCAKDDRGNNYAQAADSCTRKIRPHPDGFGSPEEPG